MVAKTEPLDIGVYMAVKGMNPAGYPVYVDASDDSNKKVIFQSTHRKSKIDVEIRNGIPHFSVRIAVEGNIVEKSDQQIPIDDRTIQEIERHLRENDIKASEELIRKTQELETDIFGFGEIVRAKIPAFWNKEIKNKANWRKMYKECTFEIDSEYHVRRIGMQIK